MLSVASQANASGIAAALLPFDQMRQQIARRLAVADEVVVDEIDRLRMRRLRQHAFELGDDLLRRLEARHAAVKAGDVAELALVGAAAGELDAADQILPELDEPVGGDREAAERQPLLGGEPHLLALEPTHRRRAARSSRRSRRPSRRCGDTRRPDTSPAPPRRRGRRAPSACRPPWRARWMSRTCGAWTCMPLTITASAQAKSSGCGARDVLVDEADRPVLRQIGRQHQEALRRHERLARCRAGERRARRCRTPAYRPETRKGFCGWLWPRRDYASGTLRALPQRVERIL